MLTIAPPPRSTMPGSAACIAWNCARTLRATGDYEAAMAAFIARQPMGRIGRAEEVAALAVYLGSDEAAFTTGQAHIIDGGWANG